MPKQLKLRLPPCVRKVRDSLLGRTPGDWDICTSARPEQVRTVFSAYRQILTGEKHGTVAVIVGGTPYEITTYRVDGQYHDSRHPDAVQFVPQVQPDLAAVTCTPA